MEIILMKINMGKSWEVVALWIREYTDYRIGNRTKEQNDKERIGHLL